MKNCIFQQQEKLRETPLTALTPWALSTCFFSPASLSNSRPNSRPRDPQRRNPQRWCDNHRHGLLEVATGAPEKPTRHGPSANHSSGFEPVTKLNWSTRSDRAGMECQDVPSGNRSAAAMKVMSMKAPPPSCSFAHEHPSTWITLTVFDDVWIYWIYSCNKYTYT